MTTQDLEQIGKMLDARLDAKIEPLRNDITVWKHEIKATEERLVKKIEATQEDTIKALSEVINEAYFLHDKRIARIEEHLDIPSIH